MSFGNCCASPPGAVSSTWSRPAPKRMSRKFGLIPHCAWKRNGSELAEAPGDDRAPEAVDAADQRRREQRQRVLRLERLRASAGRPAPRAGTPATPAMNDARAKAQSL